MEIFNGVSPLLRIMGHRFKMSICFKRPCITVTKHAIIIILTTHMVVPAVREFSFHMRFICHSKSRMKNGSLPPWNFSVNLQIWWNNSRESTVSYWAAFILIPTLQNRFEVREYQRVRSVVGRDFNAAGEHYCSVVGQVLCFALGLLALCIMCVFAPGLHCAMSLKSQVKRWMEFFINRTKTIRKFRNFGHSWTYTKLLRAQYQKLVSGFDLPGIFLRKPCWAHIALMMPSGAKANAI